MADRAGARAAEPEDETRQLQKLLAESMLAVAALKDLLARS
jgi:hypothetical protein